MNASIFISFVALENEEQKKNWILLVDFFFFLLFALMPLILYFFVFDMTSTKQSLQSTTF